MTHDDLRMAPILDAIEQTSAYAYGRHWRRTDQAAAGRTMVAVAAICLGAIDSARLRARVFALVSAACLVAAWACA